ncbi:TetR/AcrR family transcriptional regulator [Nakamurella silvestris]|nr:TetR/AcrR family transcriptional regulator [Nakamurella silvestris]
MLESARDLFATNGYRATTVRDISEAAGVNVALINRYFTSKVGLFQACLSGAVNELGAVPRNISLEQISSRITAQLAGVDKARHPHQLLLLLRTSGDEQAEEIRLGILHSFAERLASAAGWEPEDPDSDRMLLHAQVALSAALGISLLRASTGLEPLASAGEQELAEPFHRLITALLSRT